MNFSDVVSTINDYVNSIVWGVPMLILLIGTGIYFSFRLKFFQIFKSKYVLKNTFLSIFKKKSVTKSTDKNSISQFQALATALAGTIGTGNISGVATAIVLGGPGAVFWMWVSAFFGMMTGFSENVLGIYYRKKDSTQSWRGGPMYYLENGFDKSKSSKKIGKILAVAFAFFCICASIGMGNIAQVNSITSSLTTAFVPMFGLEIPSIAIGIVLAIIIGVIIIGGISRIGKVAEKIIPFVAIFYIVLCLSVLFLNFDKISYVFTSIFESAFSFSAIGGGVGGYAMKKAIEMGFKRGIFSNEAGLGSSVIVHTSSNVKEPVVQGMWSIFEVFFDTILICTLTAFVILSSTTGNAVTIDKAINNVTTDTQYVEVVNGSNYEGEIPLVNTSANDILIEDTNNLADSQTLELTTPDGQVLELNVLSDKDKASDDFVYSNIMTITGVAKTDANGNVLTNDNGEVIISSVTIDKLDGFPLVRYAFSEHFGEYAGFMLSIAIILFAFTTLLGWSFYGAKSVEYLFGSKFVVPYKIFFSLFIIVASIMSLDLVWSISDTLNGLMALPNLIGILLLSGTVIKITKNYITRKASKKPKMVEPMLSAYDDIQHMQYKKLVEEDDVISKN